MRFYVMQKDHQMFGMIRIRTDLVRSGSKITAHKLPFSPLRLYGLKM